MTLVHPGMLMSLGRIQCWKFLKLAMWIMDTPNLPQASCDRVHGPLWGDVRLDLLNKFQEEKCHLGLVTSNPEAWKFGAEFAGWFVTIVGMHSHARQVFVFKRSFKCDMEYGHQRKNRNGVSKCCKIRREKWYVVGWWGPGARWWIDVNGYGGGGLGGGWWHC